MSPNVCRFQTGRRPVALLGMSSLLTLSLAIFGGCGSDASVAEGGSQGPAAGQGGAGGAAAACASGTVLCGDACIDTRYDHANCGACGVVCSSEELCSDGQCGVTCLGGSSQCGNACVDTLHDPYHCGACGAVCAPDEVCSVGQCETACYGGSTLCSGGCVDLGNDPLNCGFCGKTCVAGEVCSEGSCAVSCLGGSTQCGVLCVDTENDPSHCGDCASVCGPGEVCSQGTCAVTCLGGSKLCAGACVDTDTDPDNCGACGATCSGGYCLNGACEFPASCSGLLKNNPNLPTGAYWVDSDGPGGMAPYEVYCEMTTAGGGWTLVASVVDRAYFAATTCYTCSASFTTCDEAPFITPTTAGSVATMLTTDYKSEAYSLVSFNEFLFVDSNGLYASYEVSTAQPHASVLGWYPAGLQSVVAENIEAPPSSSYPVSLTNASTADNPCGTLRVAFNIEDSDTPIGGSCHTSVKGPSWSNKSNNNCYWDDGGVPWATGAFYASNTSDYRLWLVR